MGYAIENLVNINLTKEEMNVVRNGMILVLSMNQRGTINLNDKAKNSYEGVLKTFEKVYENKWK